MGPTWGAEEEQRDSRGVTLLQVRTKGRRSLHEGGEEGGLGNLSEGVLIHLSALASDAPATVATAETFPSLYLQTSSPDSSDGWFLIILMSVPA